MSKVKSVIDKYKTTSVQARASAWFVICSFFQKGISFITVPIFTRILTVNEYGITALFTTWLTLFNILATLNLSGGVYNRGLLQFEEKKYTSSIQSLATTCAIVVSAIIIAFQKKISEFTGLETRLIYLMCPYMIFVFGINLWTVKERFHFRYKTVVVVTIVNTLVTTGLGLTAVLVSETDRGNEKVFWSTVGLIVIAIPFYILNLTNGKTFFNHTMWSFSLNFNLPLLPHYLSNLLLAQSDRVMINMICGTADVALYSVAFSIASITRILTDAITASLVPWRYQALDKREYRQINRVSLYMLMLVGGIVGLINLFAPEVLYIFGDRQYREAVWCIPPVMLSTYFVFAYGMFSNVEFYFLKTKFMMVASVGSAGLNIVLNYIFIGKYGYVACAYTSLACYVIYCASHYFYMMHICRKEIPGIRIYNMRVFVIITLATIGLTILSTLLYQNYLVRYVILSCAAVICFAFRKSIIRTISMLKHIKGNN